MLMAWWAFGDTLLDTDVMGLCIVLVGVLITLKSGRPNPSSATNGAEIK
jgi:drug/metabolite transporter (DMT)-like permease